MPYDALSDCQYRRSRTDPAHHRLVPYAQRHDVVARQVAVLTPVQRRTVVGKVAADGDARVERDHLADIAGGDRVDDRAVEGERVRRGDDLRDAARIAAREIGRASCRERVCQYV